MLKKFEGWNGLPVWASDDEKIHCDFDRDGNPCISIGKPREYDTDVWFSRKEAKELADFIYMMLEETK